MASRHYRAHQRYPAVAAVALHARDRVIEARGRLIDLGLGGAACELDTPLRLGEAVGATFFSEDEVTSEALATLQAEVAWVAWAETSSVRLGLRFVDNDPEQVIAALDRLVDTSDVGT